jgi:ribosomal protein S18 acetylase RimI-like enzyme
VKTSEPHPGKDGKSCVRSSKDRRLVIGLHEKEWETAFFGRRFGTLEIDVEETHDSDVEDLEETLREVLSFGDRNGYELIDIEVDVSWMHRLSMFEDQGFRLVDTKLCFLTLKKKEEMEDLPPPTRETCLVSEDMKGEILLVTRRAFTTNPSFKTRFNNERFFSRSETERYYAAWIEKYMGDRDTIFAVARDEGKIVGYLIYTKKGEHRGKPLYKAALMAVDPEHRGRKVYFDLRSFVYAQFPEREIYLDTTTQLSNLSTIRNLIRMQKTLENIKLVFFRPGPGTSGRRE